MAGWRRYARSGVALLAGWLLFTAYGMMLRAEEPVMDDAIRYRDYVAGDPTLRVAFQAPEGWSVTEERGTSEPYVQVRLLGPRNAEDTYSPHISVRQSPLKDQGGRFAGAQEAADHYTEHLLAESAIELRRDATVAEVEAIDLAVVSTIPPLHHVGLKPVPIPVKTHSLFLSKGPYLYELTYTADAREYARYEALFEHVLSTLQIAL